MSKRRLPSVIGYKFAKVTKEQRQVFSDNFGLEVPGLNHYPLVNLFMNTDGVTWGNVAKCFEEHSFPEAWLHSDGHAYTYPEVEIGIKEDQSKPQMDLVFEGFPNALLQVGANATFGATKYSPHNWLKVEKGISRYTSAMYRHLLAEAAGETYDSESKLHHATMAAWNALARLELILREEANEN